jgi:hypothetical protein
MRSPLTIIRERRDREGADAGYWEDLARQLRPDPPPPEPDPTPTTAEQVDQAIDRLETGGNMIADLYAKLGEDTDPGPVELGPIHGPPEPVQVPAGAVKSGQSVYDGGRRCATPGCGVPVVAEYCIRCTTEGAT